MSRGNAILNCSRCIQAQITPSDGKSEHVRILFRRGLYKSNTVNLMLGILQNH
jgi:hypothetical protein